MNHVDPVLEEVWRVKDELSNRHPDMADLMGLLREERAQFERATPSSQSGAPSADENNTVAMPALKAGLLLKAMGL